MEWIIIDDGTDKIKDLVTSANIPQIKYYGLPEKIPLGAKRNLMHEKSSGSIIVYMDDDDYYPPERVAHAVETLLASKTALCAGSSELYLFFKHIQKMYQCGPYGPNHATAGTFAFKRELLAITKYNESACIAEEREFLKEYTIPMVQLDPLKTILVFSHEHNTFDKRKLLDNKSNKFFKESDKTVDMFIRYNDEAKIKRFFTKDIDEKLAKYIAGKPDMKPDVVKQTVEIENQRKNLTDKGQLMIQQDGKDPVPIGPNEVVTIITNMRERIQSLTARNAELEKTVSEQRMVRFSDPIEQPSNDVQKLRKDNKELESRLRLSAITEAELRAEIQFWKKSTAPVVSTSTSTSIAVKCKSDPEVHVTL
jgi:glycosyltransferase involved in cell wall biosynthesis